MTDKPNEPMLPQEVYVIGAGWKGREYLVAHKDEKQLFEPVKYVRADLVEKMREAIRDLHDDLKAARHGLGQAALTPAQHKHAAIIDALKGNE